MPRDRIDDALDGLSARETEALIARAQRRLRACAVCHEPGGEPMVVRRANIQASMVICPACFARHRLPELRAEKKSG